MSEPFIGEIRMIGFSFAPKYWALCDGQTMPVSQHTALFSLLGTTFGGDGRSTFGLPDLRGRVPIHVGYGPGLTPRDWGERGGLEGVVLNTSEMPAHSHEATGTAMGSNATGFQSNPENHTWAVPGTMSDTPYIEQAPNVSMKEGNVDVAVQNTGGDLPHMNMQPFLCINFIIALEGLFPSRH